MVFQAGIFRLPCACLAVTSVCGVSHLSEVSLAVKIGADMIEERITL